MLSTKDDDSGVLKGSEKDDSLPEWLDSLKSELLSTKEWGQLVRDVYDGVAQRLEENHIQFFSELSLQEKSMFIDEVEKSLYSAPAYRKFQGMLSRSLDLSLSASIEFDHLESLSMNRLEFDTTGMTDEQIVEAKRKTIARRRLMEETERRSNGATTSNVDKIMERAAGAAVQLLKRLPNEKSTLRIMLNRSFPSKLRFKAWQLFLANPEAREKYTTAFSVSRISTISDKDAVISEKCQELLQQQFQEDVVSRVPSSHAVMVMMKTVLSYYQKISTTTSLPEEYFYYAIPLVFIYGRHYDRAATVIESFFGLLDMPRPKFVASVAPQITATMKKHDRDLFEHITQTFQASKLSSKDSKISSAGSNSDESFFADLLQDAIIRLFVGTLNIDSCCYVWDQCLMLGSFERMVPNFCVAVLILLRENILKADTATQVKRRFTSQARTISPRRLQALAERLFMSKLRKDLNISVVNTMGSKPSMELFDVVMYEDRQWNDGVDGLDKGLDWKGFALGDKWEGSHPKMRGRWVQDHSATDRGGMTSSKMGKDLAAEAADRRKDAMKSTKLKTAAELKQEYNAHLGGDWAKQQAAEKLKLREQRREAVRRAERDLLMSEEERLSQSKQEKEAHRLEKERRYNNLAAKRAKLRADQARKEAAKFRKEEAAKQAQRNRDDERSRNEELHEMEKERREILGQTGVAGAPYLGKPDAPLMIIKLKDGGLERKLQIRALVGDDTVDNDGTARVEYALHEAKLPLSKTGQILKLLLKFSKTKAGYVEKKASDIIASHHEKLGTIPKEAASPESKGAMPPGNQVSPPAPKDSPSKVDEKKEEFSYFGDPDAPVLKLSISMKSKDTGGKKVKVKLSIITLVPGDTLVDAKIRVEKAFKVARPEQPLDDKKVQKIVETLVKQSVKKKTGWTEKQAKMYEAAYTSINHKRAAEKRSPTESKSLSSESKNTKTDPVEDAAVSNVASKSQELAHSDELRPPPNADMIFSHIFQTGPIGLGLDKIFGSKNGNGVEVHRISPGSQADSANNDPNTAHKIGVGDHLQKVAEVDVSDMPLDGGERSVMAELRNAARPLKLTFKKCRDIVFSCEFGDGPIGLRLDDSPNVEGKGQEVLQVIDGTNAARAVPAIKQGDRLVHVGNHNVTHLEYSNTLEYLKNEARPLMLTFRRINSITNPQSPQKQISQDKVASVTTSSPSAAMAAAAASAASDSEEPHVEFKKIDPNNPPHRGGDNDKRPLVKATMQIMDALRRLALGSEREQEDTRLQIKEENNALAEDMKVAEAKVFGKKGRPEEDVIAKMTTKQKKKYESQIAKMRKVADSSFKKRQKKLKKERIKEIMKMQKQMKVSLLIIGCFHRLNFLPL